MLHVDLCVYSVNSSLSCFPFDPDGALTGKVTRRSLFPPSHFCWSKAVGWIPVSSLTNTRLTQIECTTERTTY